MKATDVNRWLWCPCGRIGYEFSAVAFAAFGFKVAQQLDPCPSCGGKAASVPASSEYTRRP